MTVFYYLCMFLCGATGTFAIQKYGRSNRTYQSIFVYALVTGIMAMGIFWAMSGFTLELSGRAVLYAALYSLFCLIGYFTQLPAYNYLGISEVGVFATCGRLILLMISGAILFGERLSAISVLRMVLLLAAALSLFVDGRRKAGKNESEKRAKSMKMIGVVLCLILTVESTMAGTVSKYIALDPLVPDANSLFFVTNFFVTAVSVVMLPILCRGRLGACVSEFRSIAPIQYLMILLSTAASNVSSLLSVLILLPKQAFPPCFS